MIPRDAALYARIVKKHLYLQRSSVGNRILFGIERTRMCACMFSDGYEDWHCARDRIGSKRGLKSEL